MGDRTGIFAGDDPFALLRDWLEAARASEPNDPEAMALATVDAEGRPDLRVVLLKGIGAGGLSFYTNLRSRKARQLAQGHAAVVLHWKTLRRQVRARGPVGPVAEAESDAYFATRHPQSRLGAWASRQSEPLGSRQDLLDAVEEARARLGEDPPRPPHWGGFRLLPLEFEFWAEGAHRLHDRFRWSRGAAAAPWDVCRLYP